MNRCQIDPLLNNHTVKQETEKIDKVYKDQSPGKLARGVNNEEKSIYEAYLGNHLAAAGKQIRPDIEELIDTAGFIT